MKYFILSILLILTMTLPSLAENKYEVMPVRKIEANPINVAVMLTEQLDSAAMVATCEYYGYVGQLSQDGYSVFMHPNDSIIRFPSLLPTTASHIRQSELNPKEHKKTRIKYLKDSTSSNPEAHTNAVLSVSRPDAVPAPTASSSSLTIPKKRNNQPPLFDL